jgi:hypothetical protein
MNNSATNANQDFLMFIAPTKTITYKKNWICQGVPCKVETIEIDYTYISPFNVQSTLKIPNEIIENEFITLENDETNVYTEIYPTGKIPISEFTVNRISINKLELHFKDTEYSDIIGKCKQDSYHSKGNNSCITVERYNQYNTNKSTSKLERIGDPVFNRSVRHSPPISKTFSREDFEQSPSYPAPIGIRESDFALPSEQNEILIELLNQFFNCKNAPECPEEIKNELGLTINQNSHLCLWCGELIDISDLNQTYCSKEHSINFCHRIPELGTKKGNVYLGHCNCNREQGGYSEEERVNQIIRLAKSNPSYREKILQELGF